MLVCAAALYMLGLQSPNDPLLLFISGNPLFSSLRLILAISLLIISFKSRFKHKISGQASLYVGIALAISSIIGLAYVPAEYSLYTYVKPLDYFMILQIGLTYSLIGLTYKTANRKLHFRKTVNSYLDTQRAKLKNLQTRET